MQFFADDVPEIWAHRTHVLITSYEYGFGILPHVPIMDPHQKMVYCANTLNYLYALFGNGHECEIIVDSINHHSVQRKRT